MNRQTTPARRTFRGHEGPRMKMQTVMGADAETDNDELRVHPYHNLAYCCSNHLYTKQDSEGSS